MESSDSNIFPSASIVLDMVKKEYDNELKRSTNLDSKVNITLTLCAALLAIEYQQVDVHSLLVKQIHTISDCIIPIICIISIILSLCLLIFATFCFIHVISVHNYTRPEYMDFLDTEVYKKDVQETIIAVTTYYSNAIISNRDITDLRMKKYQKAIYCVLLAVIFLTLANILKGN